MYEAFRAGPKADSIFALSWNMLGKLSKNASTTFLESDRFTRRSSGNGKNISSRSATTIICGCDNEDWYKENMVNHLICCSNGTKKKMEQTHKLKLGCSNVALWSLRETFIINILKEERHVPSNCRSVECCQKLRSQFEFLGSRVGHQDKIWLSLPQPAW